MSLNKTMLYLALAAAMVTGCKKNQAQAPAEPATQTPQNEAASAETAVQAPEPAPASAPVPPQPEPAKAFDINAIAVSDKPLGEWPYAALPAGYAFDDQDEIGKRTKDLARVPVWTGGDLLWVEGKVFTDEIESGEGKTYSKFEVRKGVQQALEALGAVRVSERNFDETIGKASESDLAAFRQEFTDMFYASIANEALDTYVLRRADKVIWFELLPRDSQAYLMVAEGPLPEPARQ